MPTAPINTCRRGHAFRGKGPCPTCWPGNKARGGMKKYASVDEYFATLPKDVRATLQTIRQTIKKAAPQAEEMMSYGMPAFRMKRMLAYYAAFKNHYSIFIPRSMPAFKKELQKYETVKAGFKLPLNAPVPTTLLTKIIRHAVKEDKA